MYLSFVLIFPGVFSSLFCQAEGMQDPAQQRWEEWREAQDTFPIAAWSYFSRYKEGEKGYQAYRDANLTWVQAPADHYEAAKSAGLKVILGSWEGLHKNREKLKKYVKYPEPDDRTVSGYMLKDEPHPELFESLGSAFDFIYKEDRRYAVPIIDLFPNWAVPYKRFGMSYETYVDRFVEQINPALMLNCHYPSLDDGTDRPEYYPNMELFRKKALESGIGLMGFVLIAPHRNYRMPSESDLRWQVYSHIAYGAKGIWYYNYDALVDTKTWQPKEEVYDQVKAINSELLAIGETLLQLRSKGVYHTGPEIPASTAGYTDGDIPAITHFDGSDFLLGEFRNIDDHSDDVYLILVNKRHSGDAASKDLRETAAFTVDPAYPRVYQYDNITGKLRALDGHNGSYKLEIDGGQGVLLHLSR